MKLSHKKLLIILIAGLLAIIVLSMTRVLPVYSYLDGKSPEISAEGIQEGVVYLGVIEIVVRCLDEWSGIEAVRVLIDDDSIRFERKIGSHPREHEETIKIDTFELEDGRHKLSIHVIDASWRHNRSSLQFEIEVDNTPPKIKVTINPKPVVQGKTLMVMAESNEPVSGVEGAISEKGMVFYKNGDAYRSLVGIPVREDPGQYVLNIAAEDRAGNRYQAEEMIQIVRGRFRKSGVVNLTSSKKHLLTDTKAQRQDADRLSMGFSQTRAEQVWEGVSVEPTEGIVSSGFGDRRVYNNGLTASIHMGIDIANDTGTPIKAVNSGSVTLAEELPIHGNSIVIDHGQGVFSLYSHLDRIDVNKSEMVNKGQTIGKMGTTGQSTGPHLHWGMRVNGVYVDPSEWTGRDFTHLDEDQKSKEMRYGSVILTSPQNLEAGKPK